MERSGTLGGISRRPALKERQTFVYRRAAYLDDLSLVDKYSEPVYLRDLEQNSPSQRSFKDWLTSAALSERVALVFRTQGSASLHPGLQSSYAFGVFPDNLMVPPNRSAFDYAKRIGTRIGCLSLRALQAGPAATDLVH